MLYICVQLSLLIHPLSAHLSIYVSICKSGHVSIYLPLPVAISVLLTFNNVTVLYMVLYMCMCANNIDFLQNCKATVMQLTPNFHIFSTNLLHAWTNPPSPSKCLHILAVLSCGILESLPLNALKIIQIKKKKN